MKFIKTFSVLFVLQMAASLSAQADNGLNGYIHCSNPPAKKWGTYYCFKGSFDNSQTIQFVEFGTCEGSDEAMEAEPSEIFDIAKITHNPELAASSAQWKNASAFDVTTELGEAVIYLNADSFAKSPGHSVARLKIGGKDLRLNCFNELEK